MPGAAHARGASSMGTSEHQRSGRGHIGTPPIVLLQASDMTSVQAHGNRWRVGGVPARKAPLVVLYRYPARGLKRAGPGDLQAVELGSVRTRVSQEQRSAGRTAFALPCEDVVDVLRSAASGNPDDRLERVLGAVRAQWI